MYVCFVKSMRFSVEFCSRNANFVSIAILGVRMRLLDAKYDLMITTMEDFCVLNVRNYKIKTPQEHFLFLFDDEITRNGFGR